MRSDGSLASSAPISSRENYPSAYVSLGFFFVATMLLIFHGRAPAGPYAHSAGHCGRSIEWPKLTQEA